MPKFSVIISVFNKEKYIGKTLDSVLAQTFQDFEIVVVNDGSTDNSEEIIKSFNTEKIRYFFHKNRGASAGRNRALREANGEYLAFLDADDLWEKNHLEEIEKLIQLFPKSNVFATAIMTQTNNGFFKSRYTINSDKEYQLVSFFESSYATPILSGSTTVIHRSVLEKVGYFDEEIFSGEDTEYWIRIGINYKVAFSKKITAKYLYISNSLSQENFQFSKTTDFTKFDELAKSDAKLAKYIAFNRFSLWIKCNRFNDKKNADYLKKLIERQYLSKKQLLILKLNSWQIKTIYSIKKILEKLNIKLTAFE